MSAELVEIERLTLPGHDREVARAIHNQARIRSSPIDTIQVGHLLAIGYAAGVAAGRRQAADDLFETLRAAGVYAVHTPDGRIYQLADVAFAVPTADIAGAAPAEPVEGVDR